MAQVIAFVDARRARDGRSRFWLFPNRGAGRYLYAIGFADGRTKIGIAWRPRERMFCHWISSDGAITWAHLFAPIRDGQLVEQVERAALREAAAVGRRIRRTEVFRDLPRDAAIAAVRRAIAAKA